MCFFLAVYFGGVFNAIECNDALVEKGYKCGIRGENGAIDLILCDDIIYFFFKCGGMLKMESDGKGEKYHYEAEGD